MSRAATKISNAANPSHAAVLPVGSTAGPNKGAATACAPQPRKHDGSTCLAEGDNGEQPPPGAPAG